MHELTVTHSLSKKDLVFLVAYMKSGKAETMVSTVDYEDRGDVLRKIKTMLRLKGGQFVSRARNMDELLEYVSEANDVVNDVVFIIDPGEKDFPFNIFDGAKTVHVDGEDLGFLDVEFDILRALVDDSPEPIDAEFVEEKVNYISGFEDNHLDVHIEGIRKKLGEYGSLIRGIEGEGYYIVPSSSDVKLL